MSHLNFGAFAPVLEAFPLSAPQISGLSQLAAELHPVDPIATDSTTEADGLRVRRTAGLLWAAHDLHGLKLLSHLAVRLGWSDGITRAFCEPEIANHARVAN